MTFFCLFVFQVRYVKNGWYFTEFVNNVREVRPIGKKVLGAI